MALHDSLASMLHEALPEFIEVARVAMTTRKPAGGFYGYPAATLLLCVADAIGSYYRGNRSFTMPVDGADRFIDSEGYRHLFILNSTLYGQTLAEREIRAIYEAFRNPLAHNACLAPGVLLNAGNVGDPVFYPDPDSAGQIECVNVTGFLAISEQAVQGFLVTVSDVIANSHQAQANARKGR
jgi:hypothetical protein